MKGRSCLFKNIRIRVDGDLVMFREVALTFPFGMEIDYEERKVAITLPQDQTLLQMHPNVLVSKSQ